MDKQEIISGIRRIAKNCGGKVPGFQRFSTETGLRKSDWYPKLWLRWGDAITEAGCRPNKFVASYNADFLIEKYIELIRELGRFPIEGELRIKSKADKNFPSDSSFARLGTKQERVQKIIEYCQGKSGLDDILICCSKVEIGRQEKAELLDSYSDGFGYVYLIRHGTRNEYKIGKTNNPVRREGEIRLELPEKVQPVHYIKTDDPTGVEKYWHLRFANKRKEGEWFSLTTADVRAFKKWRKIY